MTLENGTAEPVTVAYFGGVPRIEPDDRVRIVDGRDAGGKELDAGTIREADCLVVEQPNREFELLAAAVDTSVPTVVYDSVGDPVVAARATRLGISEYVTDEALEGETLADRVVVVAGRDDERRADAALEALHDVATDRTLSFEEKIERFLEVGRKRLGLDVGFLSSIEGEAYTVEAVSGTHPKIESGLAMPLSETYCRRTVQEEGLLGIHDAVETGDTDDPGYESSGWRCYLGGKVIVNDELYGTLCFGSDDPRERPFSGSERTFVELLVEWLSYEIERADHEQSLRRYRAVHEAIEGMVFVVGEGAELELVTGPLADRFGYDRERLLETPLSEFLGSEMVTKGYEALEQLQAGTDSVTVEATVKTADGVTVPVEIDLSLLSSASEFEGLVGVVYDRTALTQTRAELEQERDRFQHLFDGIPDAVVDTEFVDGEPVVRSVNPAFEEIFGYDAGSVLDRRINNLIAPENHRRDAETFDIETFDNGQSISEIEREAADGRRTFLFRGFTYTTGDDTERGFGIYTDVTERLEQERRLRVLHRLLRHNLRNEMTAIIGYAELLAEEVEDSDHREYAERIHEQAGDVAQLGQQVQRIEQALDRDRRRTAVDPSPVVSAVAERFRETASGVTIRVSDEAASRVLADDLLELAIKNLVENAVEHGSGGAPSQPPENAPVVDIETVSDGEWIDITVRDDGPGIPERERAVVGGDREITQLDHSRGLGLWVTKWVVEGVGGRLVFGECEDGATVTIRLQRAAD